MSFVERFATDGFLKIGGIFEPALIDALHSEFEQQLEKLARPVGDRPIYLEVGKDRLMLPVQLKGPFLDPRLYANPLLVLILRQILGDQFTIDNFTCVVAYPGAPEQHRHRDYPDLFPEQPGASAKLRPFALTAVIPLVDVTEENGTTKLYPGTHRRKRPKTAEFPYLSRGDCLLMDYRLLHQGMPNLSQRPRPILYVVYARPWFTDQQNFKDLPQIDIAAEDLARVPIEHRSLFRRIA